MIDIGLLGGSFNPPHLAHLAIAQAALTQLQLTRVDLMPAGQPWQKAGTAMASRTHRLAMCRSAVEGLTGLGVEPCETLRAGNTYTVDTIQLLRQQNPDHRYTLIMGADQANRLDSWRDWQTLLGLCQLALVARDGQAPTLTPAVLNACQAPPKTIVFPTMPLSSSLIRERCATGQNISPFVPQAVERYIVTHSLY